MEIYHLQALSKEEYRKDTARLKEIDKELNELKGKNDELSGRWHAEKIAFGDLHNLRKKIDDLRREAELAERAGNLERVAQVLYGELPVAEKEFAAFEKKYFGKNQRKEKFIKEKPFALPIPKKCFGRVF